MKWSLLITLDSRKVFKLVRVLGYDMSRNGKGSEGSEIVFRVRDSSSFRCLLLQKIGYFLIASFSILLQLIAPNLRSNPLRNFVWFTD